jgi:DNA-binding transcriptional MerR regulator
MSEVAIELGLPYDQLAYWVKIGAIPCFRASEKGKPRFLPVHIQSIKDFVSNGIIDRRKLSKIIRPTFKPLPKEIVEHVTPRHRKESSVNEIVSQEVIAAVEQISVEVRDQINQLNLKIEHHDQYGLYIPEKKYGIRIVSCEAASEKNSEYARLLQRSVLNLATQQGNQLFHLFDYQWNSRRNQILNFWKSTLGMNKQFVPARKCEIDYFACDDFIEAHHIQGKVALGTIMYFNLKYNDQIVGTMTASMHHRQIEDEKQVILNRLCFADGITVQGGTSKLFARMKEWAKEKGFARIVSFSDNSWTTGNIYKVLGFTLKKDYVADYFYWDSNKKKIVSKQSQQKKATNCPSQMTEREWGIQRGLYRVWDCGKKTWEYVL